MTNSKQDQQLIALLIENARMPIAELARQLNVSRTTALSRLQRLERQGVINGYTLKLSDKYQKTLIKAVVMIKSPPINRVSIERALNKTSEVITLYSISGDFDMTAIIVASSMDQLSLIIEQIGLMEGVEKTQSSIILSTKIER